jgi:hypothetical protein
MKYNQKKMKTKRKTVYYPIFIPSFRFHLDLYLDLDLHLDLHLDFDLHPSLDLLFYIFLIQISKNITYIKHIFSNECFITYFICC